MDNKRLRTDMPNKTQPVTGKGNSMLSVHRLLRHCMDLIDACDLLQTQCSLYLNVDGGSHESPAARVDQFGQVLTNYKEFIREYEQAILLFVANSYKSAGTIVAQFHQEKFMELYLMLQKKYVTILKLYELVVVSRHKHVACKKHE
jgi:hypothetical protein